MKNQKQIRPDLAVLNLAYLTAFQVWLELSQDPDCLTDLRKWQAMTQARLTYQEAKLNYLFQQRLPEVRVDS